MGRGRRRERGCFLTLLAGCNDLEAGKGEFRPVRRAVEVMEQGEGLGIVAMDHGSRSISGISDVFLRGNRKQGQERLQSLIF